MPAHTRHRVVRRIAVLGAVVAAALTTTLASPVQATPTVPPVTDLGPTSFTEPGPYGVGERTLKLKSGALVEVWFPARPADVAGKTVASYNVVNWLPPFLKSLVPQGASVRYPSGGVRNVPVARGQFPLVVFSHGFAGFRDQSTFLTSQLASWGFVVAAPEHPSRNLTKVLGGPTGTTTDVEDLRATITLMKARNANPSSWFHNHVHLGLVGAVGHSAGGRAVENLASVDDRVDTFIGLAGASVGALHEGATEVPDVPGMLMTGTADAIVELDGMDAAYTAMNAPKRFVLLGNAGHLVFSDLCEVGESDGGLLAIAELLGVPIPTNLIPLATDGCIEPALEPTKAWPAILQTVTAQLRHVFGFDSSEAGLTGLTDAFPGIVSDSRSAS